MAVELVSCRVPEDPVSPVPIGHRFLRSLLQYYSKQLHHLSPSGILHIVAFVTLCEAYMGIDPNFDLWSPFFHVQLSQGEEAMVLSGVDIYVKSEHGVDPYICLPISESTDKWQKV
jgi:hypothetical protein